MTEAVEAVVTYAFEVLTLNRVSANYMPGNVRSARLLSRLGFEVEGLARRLVAIDGVWQDHVLTSKLNRQPPRPAVPASP